MSQFSKIIFNIINSKLVRTKKLVQGLEIARIRVMTQQCLAFTLIYKLHWQIILAKNKHKIKNAGQQMLPEALFYFTQGQNQSSILPESHPEEGILPVSTVQDMGFWSFTTIWVWGHTSKPALFLLVTALLHHRGIQLLHSIPCASSRQPNFQGNRLGYGLQQTPFGKSSPPPKQMGEEAHFTNRYSV